MITWRDRLLGESQQLNIKINELHNFMTTDDFDKLQYEDRELLVQQLDAMDTYASILTKRIVRAFPN